MLLSDIGINDSSGQNIVHALHMDELVVKIEEFLLPRAYDRTDEKSILPIERLRELCGNMCIADSIRTTRAMYRDYRIYEHFDVRHNIYGKGSDIQESSLLRNEDLVSKNLEGRARIHSLAKVLFNEESLEVLKSHFDMVNAYALMGLWSEVQDQLNILYSKYCYLQAKDDYLYQLRTRDNIVLGAANKVRCCFRALRDHAVRNRGQVTMQYVTELSYQLKSIKKSLNSHGLTDGHATDMSFLDEITGDSDEPLRDDDEDDLDEDRNLLQLLRIFIISKEYDDNSSSSKYYNSLQYLRSSGQLSSTAESRSWGEVVDHFRYGNKIMKSWLLSLNNGFMPQIEASLKVVFTEADLQNRGVCHPGQLLSIILNTPHCAQLISNPENDMIRSLTEERPDVSMILYQVPSYHITNNNSDCHESQSGNDVQPVCHIEMTSVLVDIEIPSNEYMKHLIHSVSYELPITWEEFVCEYSLNNMDYTSSISFNEVLKAQLLTLLGVSFIFHEGNLYKAEETMRQALKVYDNCSLQDSLVSCELYHAVAQLMTTKYKSDVKSLKATCEERAMEWLRSDDGSQRLKQAIESACLKERINAINNAHKADSTMPILHHRTKALTEGSGNQNYDEMKINATISVDIKNKLLKQKTNEYIRLEESNIKRTIEVAYRYLIKAYEICEVYYGSNHIITTTSCIAVASVFNLSRDYAGAREWLAKALKVLLKICKNDMDHNKSKSVPIGCSGSNPTLAPLDSFDTSDNSERVHDVDEKDDIKIYNNYRRLPNNEFEYNKYHKIIAFAQIQLSQVMMKLGHIEEGILLLKEASTYHIRRAYYELRLLNKSIAESQYTSTPINRSFIAYEDVELGILLLSRLIIQYNKDKSKLLEALSLSESLLLLVEIAYGNDSSKAADKRLQVGCQYAIVEDWQSAISNIQKSCEIYEELYGESHLVTIQAKKLLKETVNQNMELLLEKANIKEKYRKDS